MSAAAAQLASPEATTSAILGASSNGWSPSRAARRPFFEGGALDPQLTGTSDASSVPDPGSPLRRKSGTLGQLRSHGLVSNSIFKQAADDEHSPLGSPSKRGALGGSPSRFGVPSSPSRGLPASGSRMGAAAAPAGPNFSLSPRKLSSEQAPSAQPPRKSQGFEALKQASCVSNSPFRNGGAPASPTRPLETPRNAWAASAAARVGAASPSRSPQRAAAESVTPAEARSVDVFGTPERNPARSQYASPSRHIADEATPRPRSRANSTAAAGDSPSSRGLLTSNRLHGPRTMSNPGSGAEDSDSARRERRKTVTFDEVLDVQEFDRESSFDVESMRSEGSALSLGETASDVGSEDGTWRAGMGNASAAALQVVNASPVNSSPAFSSGEDTQVEDLYSGSSQDSRDSSLLEDPPSPMPRLPLDEQSFEKSYATANGDGDESFERDLSFASLSGMHRVDSMVDELLHGSILGSPTTGERRSSMHSASPRRAVLPPSGLAQVRTAEPSVQIAEPLATPKSPIDNLKHVHSLAPAHSFEASIHERHDSDDSALEVAHSLASPARAEAGQAGRKPLPVLPVAAAPPARLAVAGLPTLPNWSPLMDSKALPNEDDEAVEAVTQTLARSSLDRSPEHSVHSSPEVPTPRRKTSVRGRPHISRDAVLSRVAREKQAQAQAQLAATAEASETSDERGISHAQSQMLPTRPRGSEPGTHRVLSVGTISRPSMPAPSQAHAPAAGPISAQAPLPSPVQQLDAASPLERLGAEVAAEQLQHAASVGERTPPAPAAAATWFDREESVEPESAQPPVPAKDATLRAPGPAPIDTSSGRLSPSLLGAPPTPVSPAQHAENIIARRRSKNGKPAPRRSLSTGDAMAAVSPPASAHSSRLSHEDDGAMSHATDEPAPEEQSRETVTNDLQESQRLLNASVQKAMEYGFGNGIEREISRIYKAEQKYHVSDRGAFTGVAGDKVSHSQRAGDVDSGKAWRRLRRPSDMHEYAKEMREYRASENPRKAAGKVFVFIDSFTPAALPVPARPTKFFCVLDNGLHVVKTGSATLRAGAPAKIGQEFELIQHKNLAFSLTLMVQREGAPHLLEPVAPAPSVTDSKKSSPSLAKGVRSLFSSPKKARPVSMHSPVAVQVREPILSFLDRDGAFGRSNVVFESVAQQCVGRCHVLELPVLGTRDASGRPPAPRGTLRLKLFYLPPMPSVPRNLLPENLTECIRGMQNAAWHASEPWMEGVLTQLGGDCRSWRRRPVKAQGAHLIGYNEITKRPTIKIDLSKAIAVEDSWDPVGSPAGPSDATPSDGRGSRITARSAYDDEELDETYHVERSFRITFADGERISFFADTDEQKDAWMACFRSIIERDVPPNPMWAQVALELIHSAQTHAAAAAVASPPSDTATPPTRKVSASRDAARNVPTTVSEEANTPQRAAQPRPRPMSTQALGSYRPSPGANV